MKNKKQIDKDKAITTTKQGKKELRVLVDKGSYVIYKYVDIQLNKELPKYSLLLLTDNDISHGVTNRPQHKQHKETQRKQHWFIVRLKNNKELVTKKIEEDKDIIIYDKKNNTLLEI